MPKFKKGNPGRPKGIKDRRSTAFNAYRKGFIKKVVDLALREGDRTALRIMADRLFPKLRSEYAPVNIDDEADAGRFADSVLRAAANGEIAPDVARMLIDSVVMRMDLIELSQVMHRLEELEQQAKAPPWETTGKSKRRKFRRRAKRKTSDR